jgi:hypothetical protein
MSMLKRFAMMFFMLKMLLLPAMLAAQQPPLGQRKEGTEMIRRIACLVTVGLMLSCVTATAGKSEKEAAAVSAAEKWLAVVDKGKYEESWKEAAEYFKNAVKQKQWEQSLQAVRNPLGKLISRKVNSKTYMTSLPGAPDGEYVIIQFDTSFENKKKAVETVTTMMDKGGGWRVSGYYIR